MYGKYCLVILLLISNSTDTYGHNITCFDGQSPILTVKPTEIDQLLGKEVRVEISIVDPCNYSRNETFDVMFECEKKCVDLEPMVLGPETNYIGVLNLTTPNACHDHLNIFLPNCTVSAQVVIRVRTYDSLAILEKLFGWSYTLAWAIVAWPEVIIYFQHQSVAGISFDFALFRVSGFFFYAIFNLAVYLSEEVQKLYEKNNNSEKQFELNDLVFAIHNLLVSIVIFSQIIIYQRNRRRISSSTVVVMYIAWSVGLFLVLLARYNFGFEIGVQSTTYFKGRVTWLVAVNYFASFQLAIIAIRYIELVWKNYQHKSTIAWPIWLFQVDLLGGILCFYQMWIVAFNYNDWNSLKGNSVKLGLAIVAIILDPIILWQQFFKSIRL